MSKEYNFIGTCIVGNNPFGDKIDEIVENAKEITRQTFLKHCNVDPEIKKQMFTYLWDFSYFKNKKENVYFYEWSAIEHFFKKED